MICVSRWHAADPILSFRPSASLVLALRGLRGALASTILMWLLLLMPLFAELG